MVYDVICDEYELIYGKDLKNAKNAIGNRSFLQLFRKMKELEKEAK